MPINSQRWYQQDVAKIIKFNFVVSKLQQLTVEVVLILAQRLKQRTLYYSLR